MTLHEGMAYPPKDWIRDKMLEHSTWYSGDESQLTEYFSLRRQQMFTVDATKNLFWSRQYKASNKTIPIHIPVASDISSTCADLLFGDTPEFKISEAHEKSATASQKQTQDTLDTMLSDIGFYAKLLEAAESASAIGGVYIKAAWDEELSPYPIPVIEQCDNAYPEFKFGILSSVTFVKPVRVDGATESSNIWRLAEIYTYDGAIKYQLYKGTSQNLGKLQDINSIEETKGIQDVYTGINSILCVYIPNMLPNKLNRDLYIGRSDYLGSESIYHSIDETYSAWMRDIYIAKGKVLVPRDYLRRTEDGDSKYDLDTMIYEKLDVDPLSSGGSSITPVQFEIRSEQYYKTCLELITRAVTAAGYSIQTFGINVDGRAESGTALNIRERKSFNTKVKKQQYWEAGLKKIIKILMQLYNLKLGGKMDLDCNITTEFSDGSNNTLAELSSSLLALANAQAASTEQKVRYLHKDWSDEQIQAEAKRILDETQSEPLVDIDTQSTEDDEMGDE